MQQNGHVIFSSDPEQDIFQEIATNRFRISRAVQFPFFTELALNCEDTWIPRFGRWKLVFARRAGRGYRLSLSRKHAGVIGRNSGSDAFKKIYHLFTSKLQNACRRQFNKWKQEIKVPV